MFGRFLSRFDLSCPSPPGQSVALHPFSSYFRVPTYLPYVRLTAYIYKNSYEGVKYHRG